MSAQRVFLIVFGIVSAGLGGCIPSDGILRIVGAALGAALTLVASVFWTLDQRSAFLVKHAEFALRKLEQSHMVEHARLFQQEPDQTNDPKTLHSRFMRVWTYGESFRLVFGLAAVIGILGALLSVALYFGWCT